MSTATTMATTATTTAAKKFALQIPARTGASIRAAAQRATEGRHAVGVVVSAGRMQRTVQVQSTRQRRDTFLRRNYAQRPLHMVADPADSLRAGDVVRIAPWRTAGGARRVSHVVTEIVRAFGPPVDARPALIPLQDLLDARHAKWEAKHARRAERQALRQGGDASATTPTADAPHQQTRSEQSIAARKLDGLADDASRLEARAHELESRAERDGVDLEHRAGQMPKS